MNDFLQQIRSGAFSSRDKRYTGNQNRNRPYSGNAHGNEKRYKSKGGDTAIKDETIKKLGETLKTLAVDQKKMVRISMRRAEAEERRAHAMENIARCLGKYTGMEIQEFVPREEHYDDIIAEETEQATMETEAPDDDVYEDTLDEITESMGNTRHPSASNRVALQTDSTEAGYKTKKESPDTDNEPEADDSDETISPAMPNDTKLQKSKTVTPETDTATDAEKSEGMNKDEVMELIQTMREEGSTYNEIAAHLAGLDLPTFSGRGKWHAQTIHRLCQ
jgi:hypothetical protein